MLFAKDFRKIAYESLSSKWGVAVGIGFVASLLMGSIFGFSIKYYNNSRLLSDNFIDKFLHSQVVRMIIPILGYIIFIIFALKIVNTIITGAVLLGYSKFNLNLVDGKPVNFSQLFSQFNRLGAGFCMEFLTFLYTILWFLLFIIPGIIASLSYDMTPYIMLENPELGANEAITLSKKMMEGNKERLFCLDLSFIGWDLLCICTLGIGFLWLTPYVEASHAAFYREISGTAKHID